MAGKGIELTAKQKRDLSDWVHETDAATVAKRIGCSVQSIGHWLSGETAPFHITHAALVKALDRRSRAASTK